MNKMNSLGMTLIFLTLSAIFNSCSKKNSDVVQPPNPTPKGPTAMELMTNPLGWVKFETRSHYTDSPSDIHYNDPQYYAPYSYICLKYFYYTYGTYKRVIPLACSAYNWTQAGEEFVDKWFLSDNNKTMNIAGGAIVDGLPLYSQIPIDSLTETVLQEHILVKDNPVGRNLIVEFIYKHPQ